MAATKTCDICNKKETTKNEKPMNKVPGTDEYRVSLDVCPNCAKIKLQKI